MCYACAALGLSASWATYDHELTQLDGSGLVGSATGGQGSAGSVWLAASGTSSGSTGSTTTDAVPGGTMWSGTVTYSFPDAKTDYESYNLESTNNFAAVSFEQMQAVRYILE